jgi:hypothetical protein
VACFLEHRLARCRFCVESRAQSLAGSCIVPTVVLPRHSSLAVLEPLSVAALACCFFCFAGSCQPASRFGCLCLALRSHRLTDSQTPKTPPRQSSGQSEVQRVHSGSRDLGSCGTRSASCSPLFYSPNSPDLPPQVVSTASAQTLSKSSHSLSLNNFVLSTVPTPYR